MRQCCLLLLTLFLTFAQLSANEAVQEGDGSLDEKVQQSVADEIPYKHNKNNQNNSQITKVLLVFFAMVILAIGSVLALRLTLYKRLPLSEKRRILVNESRRLDRQTNAHLIEIDSENYVVVSSSGGVSITKHNQGENP